MNEPKRRQGWKAFLTPGWVLTAVLVLTFTYFAFTFLGPWQLNKGEQKSAFNHRLEAAMQYDPVPAAEVLPRDGSSAGLEKEWTHVQLQGRFITDAEVLLRNRPVSSSPAFQILTPFQTDAGQTILVNRGWVPPVEGADVPEIPNPPTWEVTVTGYVRMSEAEANTPPTQSQGFTQVTGIHTETIGEEVEPELKAADALSSGQKTPLVEEYIQLDEASVDAMNEQDSSDATMNAIPLPQLDDGPHLSYGIQWITFGIAAPAALIWFGYSEIRERRREKQEIAEAEAAQGVSGAGANRAGANPAGAAVGADSKGAAAGEAESEAANKAQEQAAEKRQQNKQALAAIEPDNAELNNSKQGKTDVEQAVEENSAERKLADRYGGTRSRFEERRSQKRGERF
ncbi:SURF1 family cytochrome oxidase biogenesis protein [Corynebacterium dentalis]|uniref:SURF1 family cytochrome oxidase biogenesis protein n=1 Tax=Corynebacterium dentalis TaxID=2014528 RepID=UPI0028A08162|nr:SURF1 family protein [Corynebacterium dentalis]